MKEKKLIDRQIVKGTAILDTVSKMRERHTNVINVIAYENEDVQSCRKLINIWQLTTQDVLASIYGKDEDHVKTFQSTITAKDLGFNFKSEFQTEINKGLSVLEASLESLNMGLEISFNKDQNKRKSTKIFISHKTEDKPFVDELIKLLEFIVGANTKRIFCSSVGGYDIKPGKEILSELKRQFDEYEILFLIVHSPRYYTSPICLNEMGAAWVLGSKFFSFLTPDCSFSVLKGAIDSKYMSIKVNDPQETVVSKLNAFKDYLLDVFDVDKEGFNGTKWETVRNDFILCTSSIKPLDGNSDKNDNREAKSGHKANIMAELVSKNPYIVNIVNRGDGDAKQLRVKLSEDSENMLISGLEHFPFDNLKPGKYVSINVFPCIGDPDILKMTFVWKEKDIEFSSDDFVKI